MTETSSQLYAQSRMTESKAKQESPQSRVTESKARYEFLWRTIFLFISTVAAFLVKKVYIYQTSEFGLASKKGNFAELAVFGVPVALVFILCDALFHYFLDQKCAAYYVNQAKYPTEELRLKKAYTIIKWAFSLLYYGASSVAAFLIILPTTFMPTWLGGEGYCTDLTRYVDTFDEANYSMKVFYVLQFGKHLGRFFQHCFIRAEGNFYEYALHHGLSTFLIFFSYLTNQWIIGIFVLLIHDVSDFFLILARAYREYKYANKIILNIFYVMAMSSWLFCRVFLLSACCVYSSLSSVYNVWLSPAVNEEIKSIFVPCGLFMGIMLFLLEILQLFWTYYIASSFVSVSISEKIAKHTYD